MKPLKKIIKFKNNTLISHLTTKISNKIKSEKQAKNYSDLVKDFESKIKNN